MREAPGPAAEELDLATVLHAMSDPLRLELVAGLDLVSEACCGDIVGDRVSKSTRSHHVRVLREAGVVATRAVGTTKYARLRRAELEARFPGLLDAVLAAARQQAAENDRQRTRVTPGTV
ncbi:MAG: ArsR/SmtB family transcription factor [Frankia sp.]